MGQRSRGSRTSSLTTSPRLEGRSWPNRIRSATAAPRYASSRSSNPASIRCRRVKALAPGQLGELIEPLLGRRLQPHSGGHAITWIHRCILGRVPVPYALGLIRQSLERQLDDIPEAP